MIDWTRPLPKHSWAGHKTRTRTRTRTALPRPSHLAIRSFVLVVERLVCSQDEQLGTVVLVRGDSDATLIPRDRVYLGGGGQADGAQQQQNDSPHGVTAWEFPM